METKLQSYNKIFNKSNFGKQIITQTEIIMIMKIAVFWDVTLHSAVEYYQSFGAVCCLHLQSLFEQVPPKHWQCPSRLHSVTPQKTVVLILTAVRTPNITEK
jgi:hypothetical protein